MDTLDELSARMEELMGISLIVDEKLNKLRAQAEDLIDMHHQTMAGPRVAAAGRYQWRVPDQPAINLAASLDPVTRKCSLCAYRHPTLFIQSRAAAAYLGKKPPYDMTKCSGCYAIFEPPSTGL
jgi:hypothetical protein